MPFGSSLNSIDLKCLFCAPYKLDTSKNKICYLLLGVPRDRRSELVNAQESQRGSERWRRLGLHRHGYLWSCFMCSILQDSPPMGHLHLFCHSDFLIDIGNPAFSKPLWLHPSLFMVPGFAFQGSALSSATAITFDGVLMPYLSLSMCCLHFLPEWQFFILNDILFWNTI